MVRTTGTWGNIELSSPKTLAQNVILEAKSRKHAKSPFILSLMGRTILHAHEKLNVNFILSFLFFLMILALTLSFNFNHFCNSHSSSTKFCHSHVKKEQKIFISTLWELELIPMIFIELIHSFLFRREGRKSDETMKSSEIKKKWYENYFKPWKKWKKAQSVFSWRKNAGNIFFYYFIYMFIVTRSFFEVIIDWEELKLPRKASSFLNGLKTISVNFFDHSENK